MLISELEGRAGIGAGPGHVPLGHRCNLFREVQRHCPAAQRGGAGIGDTHIHLKEGAARIGRSGRAGIRSECLAARQGAGQEQD
jgi:hypothetical protein